MDRKLLHVRTYIKLLYSPNTYELLHQINNKAENKLWWVCEIDLSSTSFIFLPKIFILCFKRNGSIRLILSGVEYSGQNVGGLFHKLIL